VKFAYMEHAVDPRPGEEGPQSVYEPLISVRVIGPAGVCVIRGLLDTGSTDTLVPMQFLDWLGVEKGPRFNLRAAGGSSFPAWLGNVDLELKDGVKVHRWSAHVGFTPFRKNAIWGHAGFLDYFTATFNGRKRSVSLQPNNTFTLPIYADLTF